MSEQAPRVRFLHVLQLGRSMALSDACPDVPGSCHDFKFEVTMQSAEIEGAESLNFPIANKLEFTNLDSVLVQGARATRMCCAGVPAAYFSSSPNPVFISHFDGRTGRSRSTFHETPLL